MKVEVLSHNNDNGLYLARRGDLYIGGYSADFHNMGEEEAKNNLEEFIGENYNQEPYCGYIQFDFKIIYNKEKELFKIQDFQELYQFNCSSNALELIKMFCKSTANNDLIKHLENPMNFRTKIFEGFKEEKIFSQGGEYYGRHKLEYKIKGKTYEGENAFHKYAFLNYDEISSIEELVDIYISFEKMLAKLCFDYNDDSYLSNSPWAEKNAQVISEKFDEII